MEPTETIKVLSDDALREIEARALEVKELVGVGQFGKDMLALCATVRALRATHSCGAVDGGSVVGGCGKEVLTADGFRCADCLAWFHRDCINEHFKLDAYVKKLRELREQGAIDDWKKSLADKEAENTALREQLAQLSEVRDQLRDKAGELQSQLAQMKLERNTALEEIKELNTAEHKTLFERMNKQCLEVQELGEHSSTTCACVIAMEKKP